MALNGVLRGGRPVQEVVCRRRWRPGGTVPRAIPELPLGESVSLFTTRFTGLYITMRTVH